MVQPGSAMVTSAACSARPAPPSAITVTGWVRPGLSPAASIATSATCSPPGGSGGTAAGSGVAMPVPATVTVAGPACAPVSLTTVTCTICRGRAALPRKRRVEVTALIRIRSWSHAGRVAAARRGRWIRFGITGRAPPPRPVRRAERDRPCRTPR